MPESQTTILVVDDEMTAVKRIEALLMPHRYRVLTALSGEEALRALHREKPDLVLLDVLMPGLDGFEVCRRIKTDAETQLIPVLLMTVLNDMKDRIEGFDAGADDFLSKPVHRDELLARIRASLRRKATFEHKVDATRQRLQSATERKSQLLTHMSHELRTKLDAIIGFSEILQEQFCGELNDRQAEYISYILSSGTDLLMGVNGLLEMAKIEIGEASLQRRTLSLRPSIETCLDLVRGHAQAHAITLSLTMEETIGDVVGDETQLKQMIFHLLSMAVQLTPDGGEVGIEVTQMAQTIRIVIRSTDTAPVSEDHQAALEGSDKAWAGAGAGLALTKRFAELHGGTLEVQHLTGQGSTYTLSLPVSASSFNPPPSPA
ncbi:ATP-binding response regulator [Candidatus Entotheonella palauensis]|uniref:ATP-binding response regulator n=1 Tax=Candidatus Entotheonella palauensis TaxID=93172 RepID=UPI000B7FE72F|nr:response regulator [Candidatus Entotheonella palauensis]